MSGTAGSVKAQGPGVTLDSDMCVFFFPSFLPCFLPSLLPLHIYLFSLESQIYSGARDGEDREKDSPSSDSLPKGLQWPELHRFKDRSLEPLPGLPCWCRVPLFGGWPSRWKIFLSLPLSLNLICLSNKNKYSKKRKGEENCTTWKPYVPSYVVTISF